MNIDASELEKLERIRNEIYQLRQDAGIVSSRWLIYFGLLLGLCAAC